MSKVVTHITETRPTLPQIADRLRRYTALDLCLLIGPEGEHPRVEVEHRACSSEWTVTIRAGRPVTYDRLSAAAAAAHRGALLFRR